MCFGASLALFFSVNFTNHPSTKEKTNMKKIIATLIAASFLGLGSLSFAEEKSAAPAKEKPAAVKPKPGTVGSIKDKPTAVKPKPTSPADANPNVKPPAGAVQDGTEKPKPKPIIIVDPTKPRPERKPFPPHWGKPPDIQLKDYRPLPGGFGFGSSCCNGALGNTNTILYFISFLSSP